MLAKQNNNQSIIKAFQLLELFDNTKTEWGVRELALKTGFNKSTTYRLLNTLTSLQVLQQNENEKYQLGSKLFELGNRVSEYQSLQYAIKNTLKKVASDIEETVLFGVLKENKVFYINKVESSQGLKISTQVGAFQPLHATAIGKVLLAFTAEQKASKILTNLEYTIFTKKTITSKEKLKTVIKQTKKQGYALDLEEFELGLICIAIPVFNKKQECIGAISASGPSSRFETKNVVRYVQILQGGLSELAL